MLLSARGISKLFDGTQALCNVDLDIAAGTVHELVGENGAGKSTLSKIIAGVVAPGSGALLWESISVLGLERFRAGRDFSPRLTTVAQPTQELGKRVMRMLFDEIDRFGESDSGMQDEVVVLEPELRVRNSTAPPFR